MARGTVSAAGAPVSGRGTLPAAGTFSDEKSGVSPGRNDGSGTCSASFGAFRRNAGFTITLWDAPQFRQVRGFYGTLVYDF